MPGKPFLIGVAGGTSSGKTSVCKKIVEHLESTICLGNRKVAIINQESFHNHLTKDEMNIVEKNQYNFDHPDAFDTVLMKSILFDIINGKKVSVPVYDPNSNSRLPDTYNIIENCDVVLFEGILVFYHKEIRDLFNMKLFVDIDADTRLSRRVVRDLTERCRTLEFVLHQYTHFVKPAFEEFCLPTKKYADVIIPRGVENTVAINLIVHHLRDILNGGSGIKYMNGGENGGSKVNGKINGVNGLNGVNGVNGLDKEVEKLSIVRH